MPITLKPHNEQAYVKVKNKYNESNRVAVIHPTGTGKSYIALKMLEENKDKKAIFVAPSNAILHGIKNSIFESGMNMTDFPNLKRITYQKLMMLTKEEIEQLDFDIIVLDEFHHCGAPEWGNGVNKLIDNNPNANILGLSATPIRYFDGLRDMSDELFDGNVASEMTLEEAIEQKILPEATYVSTLYGYNEELEVMKNNIEGMSNKQKKEQAEKLYGELSKKLDENTKNLPELLSTYMKNRNGKYIVFCRNIEDMKEKMSKVNEIFGNINSNINVYGVSSDNDLRKNDKMLTEFENDNDENSLKLMYAVDMLNEGYHISSLDGVVMMRPTLSPTIFTQQLGRALSVGGDNKPVILDLVNNFDSCKIIEDFAEKMKQYENKNKDSEKRENQERRLSIFDTTKEFREIAQKIKELSKNKVFIDEKIEILQRYFKTHGELSGNTIYEGHPIGQWAIQIRSDMNRYKKGINSNLNLSEEQIEVLNSIGILESVIEHNTIDEKIEGLLKWIRKYPNIKPIQQKVPMNELYQHRDDFIKDTDIYFYDWEKRAGKAYKKVYRYYDYLKKRYNELTDEQILKCKEENVGGVFGYSTDIEKLAKEYRQDEDVVDKIVNKYSSMEKYLELYETGEAPQYVKLNHIIDIDYNKNDKQYNMLVCRMFGEPSWNETYFYSSSAIDDALEILTEKEREIIVQRYGLRETLAKTQKELGEELGISSSYVGTICKNALSKIKHHNKVKSIIKSKILLKNDELQLLTEEEKKNYEELKKLVYVNARLKPSSKYEKDSEFENENRENTAKYFKYLKYLEKKIEIEESRSKLNKDKNDVKDKLNHLQNIKDDELVEYYLYSTSKNEVKIEKDILETSIDSLNLSSRAYNALGRANIWTVRDILLSGEENIRMLRNMGRKTFEEIEYALNHIGLSLYNKEMRFELQGDKLENIISQFPSDIQEKLKTNIDELELSATTYNILEEEGIEKVSDIISICEKGETNLLKLRNFGQASFEELKDKLKGMDLDLSIDKLKDKHIEKNYYEKYLEKLDLEKRIKIIGDLPVNIGDISFGDILFGRKCNMDFSVRAHNVLGRSGKTIREIAELSAKGELKRIRNVGDKIVDEINNKLESMGIAVQKDENGNYSNEDLEKALCMKLKDAVKLFDKTLDDDIRYLIERYKVHGVEDKVKESIIKEKGEEIEQWKQEKIQEYCSQIDEINKKLEDLNNENIENPLNQEYEDVTLAKSSLGEKSDENEKKKNKQNIESSKEFSELERLKNDKEALEEYVKKQEEKIRKARELLTSYGELSNDDKVNSDNENPDFKDD